MNIPARLPAIFSVIVLSLVLAQSAGAVDFGSTVTLSADTADGEDTTDYTVSSPATTITVIGDGTYTLSGNNTYSGGTTVNAGTLAGNIADATDLTVLSGATYDGAGVARSVVGRQAVLPLGACLKRQGNRGPDCSFKRLPRRHQARPRYIFFT